MASINLQTGQVFNLIKVGGQWQHVSTVTDPVLTFSDDDNDKLLDDGEIGTTENDIGAALSSGNYVMVISGGTTAVFYSSVVLPDTFDFDSIATQLSNGFEDLAFCFAGGTLLETDTGMTDVTALSAGDVVMTKDAGLREILWIGYTRFTQAQLMLKPDLTPIRIQAGALGKNLPTDDLTVSPQHRMLMSGYQAWLMFDEGEVLVPAKSLLNDNTITRCDPADGVDYYHILLDGHHLVNANGSWSESLSRGAEAFEAMSEEARVELQEIFPDQDFTVPSDTCRVALTVRDGIALSQLMITN